MQAKRIQVNENNLGAGAGVNAEIEVPVSPREQVNFHNIWIGVTNEPQNAGANAQGTWLCYIRRENAPSIIFTDAVTNAETHNAIIIACGVWGASNESVYNFGTQIKTSRNLQAGDKLVITSTVTGVTAGLVSVRVMICAHTVRA